VSKHSSGSRIAFLIKPVIETTKHRESLLPMLDSSLMAIDAERTSKTQITNRLKNACFAASVSTMKKIERRRERRGFIW